MKAMIFAAGLGTRLRPLTDTIPKALLPVAGRPLITRVICKLVSAGYDDIVVNVHHFADMIEDYIRSEDDFGIRIRFSDEREMLLDTGGGILKARALLEGDGQFLVHNVDILSDADLGAFRESVPDNAVASLLVGRRHTSRYLLFDSGMRMIGWTNVSSGLVRSPYLPDGSAQEGSTGELSCGCPGKSERYAFSGIHILKDGIFPLLEDYSEKRKRAGISCPEKFSITDFYIDNCRTSVISGYSPASLEVIDVGKTASLSLAEDFIRRHQ